MKIANCNSIAFKFPWWWIGITSATIAEKGKHDNYQELKNTYHFIPVAVETLGSWGQEALKFIKEVGSRIAQLTGEKKSTYYLFQSLDMAYQRGNSITVTVPDVKKLDAIYYL